MRLLATADRRFLECLDKDVELFAQSLRTRGLRRIPMLFQHDPAEPIGVWLDLFEDARGLRARGRLIADVARAREVLALVRAGAIDGLSIGFRTVRGRIDPRTRVRRLEQIDLWEISIVTFPLLAGARVRAVEKARPALRGASRVIPPAAALPRAERAWRTIATAGAGRRAAERKGDEPDSRGASPGIA